MNVGTQAVEELIVWINEANRPVWWRHAVRLLLEKQILLKGDDEILLQLARKQAGFNVDIDLSTYTVPVSSEGFSYEEDVVKLLKISSVINVSSLAQNQDLEFSAEGLTVIYGDNGAGKSSYAKILKNACLTRGEIPLIKGNVFTGNDTTPSAQLSFQVGSREPDSY
ncbi:MAG: AAA family ATPase, partial [Lentisphaeraceae bacterium]|nr:AAA family ATPase [Lentisphaeraceae bacterium]